MELLTQINGQIAREPRRSPFKINSLLQAALDYCGRGFSVIPVKPDKKPYLPWAEYQTRRATPDEIKTWWSKWPKAMIGIVTGPVSGLLVIDCDTPEGFNAVQEKLPDSLIMPLARTPRGGQHLYFSYPEDCNLTVGAGVLPGLDFRGLGGYIVAPPSQNGKGKYIWQIGLDEAAPPDMPSSLLNLLSQSNLKSYSSLEYSKGDEVTDSKRLQTTSNDFRIFEQGRRDNDLFHVANCLIKGGAEPAFVSQVLQTLAENCRPPFPEKEIPTKIQSALGRAAKREINFAEEVRDFVVTSNGFFLTSDVFKRLQVTSRQEKKNVVLALLRLFKDGLIERHGERDGCYRRIENEVESIDFMSASDETLDIRWPFEIEKYVLTLPNSIVVVAGEPDAGKTAFLLNLVRLNQDRHDIHYFSSEMGAAELRNRLLKFDCPLDSWKFSAKERSGNFADVIRPDDLNVVDFMEIHDEFYKVGGLIKQIYDKVNKGVAVIALQKNRGADYGLGGSRGLEKPRLYLTMGQGQIKIIKAKNWAMENVRPTGLTLDFKLVAGCKFLVEKNWRHE